MSDYLFLMESRLSPEQWQAVSRMQKAAEALDMTLYLVGGAVRDLICGFPIDDLDFVAEGKALRLVRSLKDQVRVTWESASLEAAELEFSSGVSASVCMARTETYSDKHPVVITPASIIADLKRRDFSINAIGLSLNPQSRGLLLDPTNGAGDMERKEIRALHNHTFIDDPVRMFRAVRLRTRLGFTWEGKTAALYQKAKEQRLQENASPEGLSHELRQIARERNPVDVLRALDKEKLLPALHPRLHGPRLNLKGIAQATKTSQALSLLGLRPRSFDLFLYLMAAGLPPKDRAQMVKRLNLRKPESVGWQKLGADAKGLAKELMGKEAATPTRAYNLLISSPPELIVLLQLEYRQSKVQSRIRAFLQKYLPLRFRLPEKELEELGLAPGTPLFQKILDAYFYAVLEGKLRSRGEQTRFLKKMAAENKPKEVKPASKELAPAKNHNKSHNKDVKKKTAAKRAR